MMRVVAVVGIPFTETQSCTGVVFKKEVLELKHNVPEKEDCQGYKFEQVNGKLCFPPALYISDASQNVLTKKVRRKYVEALKADGFFDPKQPDSGDDDDDTAESEQEEEAETGGGSSD